MLEKLFGLKENSTFAETRTDRGFHEFYDDFIYNLRATLHALTNWNGLRCCHGRDLSFQCTRDVRHGVFYKLSCCVGTRYGS